MHRVLSKNAIVTSLSVTRGKPFLLIYAQRIFGKIRLNQCKEIFRLKMVKNSPPRLK